MARMRMVKPEFWTSEQVMECSPNARLLFIGMWNFCDDAGIHPASAKTLKAEVFPSDDITASDVQAMVGELIANGLVMQYEADGKQYLSVTGWDRHQKIDRPNYKHPKPRVKMESPSDRRALDDESPSDRRALDEQSPPEGNRRGVGEEGKGEERSALPADEPPSTTRKGEVCRLLRQSAGVADAAPHQLDDATWGSILAKRTDEEIVEFAKAKVASRAGQRTGLRYLAPGLLEDPKPVTANARASPGGGFSVLDAIKRSNTAGASHAAG